MKDSNIDIHVAEINAIWALAITVMVTVGAITLSYLVEVTSCVG